MAFNITGFLNNIVGNGNNVSQNAEQTNMTNSSAQSAANSSAQVPSSVQSMLAGDILTGIISDISGTQVTLTLPNGENIFARLEADANLLLGQSMTFLIKENTSTSLALKPLAADAQQMVMVQKALEAAGLAVNESNVSVVEELLARNMSISSDILNEMIRNNVKFPDTKLSTIADLIKLNIPVTAENIQQFEAYSHFEHQLDSQLKNIPEQLTQMLSNITDNTKGSVKDISAFLTNITAALYEGAPDEAVQLPVHTALGKEGTEVLVKQLQNTFGDNAKELVSQLQKGEISVKDTLLQISQLIEKPTGPQKQLTNSERELLHSLFESKEMNQLVKTAIQENMYLTPQMAAKEDSIKEFYKRVRTNLEKISSEVDRHGEGSVLSKNLGDIKSNIDFMNDLNKNMTYFQMPIKFSESAGNGDLYVFTNKKSLAQNSDHVSAMLHLDMENLGPIDIYVMLAGKKVSTKFYLESDELLDFVYEHIDQLDKRLEALGYSVKYEMKIAESENSFDFIEDFIEKDIPSLSTSQYVFDIKA